ncbi:hypothetical protein FB451DRAFT_1413429 [Mycena latifolia]|nr:hypothetical protein FB451DRAFT_1413429 [Mycena latifolia]
MPVASKLDLPELKQEIFEIAVKADVGTALQLAIVARFTASLEHHPTPTPADPTSPPPSPPPTRRQTHLMLLALRAHTARLYAAPLFAAALRRAMINPDVVQILLLLALGAGATRRHGRVSALRWNKYTEDDALPYIPNSCPEHVLPEADQLLLPRPLLPRHVPNVRLALVVVLRVLRLLRVLPSLVDESVQFDFEFSGLIILHRLCRRGDRRDVNLPASTSFSFSVAVSSGAGSSGFSSGLDRISFRRRARHSPARYDRGSLGSILGASGGGGGIIGAAASLGAARDAARQRATSWASRGASRGVVLSWCAEKRCRFASSAFKACTGAGAAGSGCEFGSSGAGAGVGGLRVWVRQLGQRDRRFGRRGWWELTAPLAPVR